MGRFAAYRLAREQSVSRLRMSLSDTLCTLVACCVENDRMKVQGLHHVQLAMPQGMETQAEEFYSGLLGIPRVAKPLYLEARGGCWFESAEVRMHLGVEEEFCPARKAHPALLVS